MPKRKKTTISPERQIAIDKRLKIVPNSAKTIYKLAVAKKCPPAKAIKSFCLECCGWDRGSIRECTGYACSLWAYRPFQNSKVEANDCGNDK